jgi:hypothetical protein
LGAGSLRPLVGIIARIVVEAEVLSRSVARAVVAIPGIETLLERLRNAGTAPPAACFAGLWIAYHDRGGIRAAGLPFVGALCLSSPERHGRLSVIGVNGRS